MITFMNLEFLLCQGILYKYFYFSYLEMSQARPSIRTHWGRGLSDWLTALPAETGIRVRGNIGTSSAVNLARIQRPGTGLF
jgi:hypothetical protein